MNDSETDPFDAFADQLGSDPGMAAMLVRAQQCTMRSKLLALARRRREAQAEIERARPGVEATRAALIREHHFDPSLHQAEIYTRQREAHPGYFSARERLEGLAGVLGSLRQAAGRSPEYSFSAEVLGSARAPGPDGQPRPHLLSLRMPQRPSSDELAECVVRFDASPVPVPEGGGSDTVVCLRAALGAADARFVHEHMPAAAYFWDNVAELRRTLKKQALEIVGQARYKRAVVAMLTRFAFGGNHEAPPYLNMLLMGPPGCGKSFLAERLGRLFSRAGLLLRGSHYREAGPRDLVAEYEGQTYHRTTRLLESCYEGVLFIDEIYAIAASGYAPEAAAAMLAYLSRNKGCVMVVGAGYEALVRGPAGRSFLGLNPGLAGRFPTQIVLEAHPAEALVRIVAAGLKDPRARASACGRALLAAHFRADPARTARDAVFLAEQIDGAVAAVARRLPSVRASHLPRDITARGLRSALPLLFPGTNDAKGAGRSRGYLAMEAGSADFRAHARAHAAALRGPGGRHLQPGSAAANLKKAELRCRLQRFAQEAFAVPSMLPAEPAKRFSLAGRRLLDDDGVVLVATAELPGGRCVAHTVRARRTWRVLDLKTASNMANKQCRAELAKLAKAADAAAENMSQPGDAEAYRQAAASWSSQM